LMVTCSMEFSSIRFSSKVCNFMTWDILYPLQKTLLRKIACHHWYVQSWSVITLASIWTPSINLIFWWVVQTQTLWVPLASVSKQLLGHRASNFEISTLRTRCYPEIEHVHLTHFFILASFVCSFIPSILFPSINLLTFSLQ
jgi:hypothetical protein